MPGNFRRRMGHWQGQFKGYGYRLTLSRQAILEVLSRTREHLSAEEIYHQVHKIHPASGIATVYRTLELLVQLQMVYKFDFGDGRARYELQRNVDNKQDHHHHLICIHCQRIINYTEFIDEEVELLKKTERGLEKKYGFKIMKHILHFYGLCQQCRGKE